MPNKFATFHAFALSKSKVFNMLLIGHADADCEAVGELFNHLRGPFGGEQPAVKGQWRSHTTKSIERGTRGKKTRRNAHELVPSDGWFAAGADCDVQCADSEFAKSRRDVGFGARRDRTTDGSNFVCSSTRRNLRRSRADKGAAAWKASISAKRWAITSSQSMAAAGGAFERHVRRRFVRGWP